MKKALFWGLLLVFAVLAIFNTGCAGTQPRTIKEMFPKWNSVPMAGEIIWEGSAASTVKIFNATTNELEWEFADSGASPATTFNGRVTARRKDNILLPKGGYRLKIETFYYRNYWFPPNREPISLNHFQVYIHVGDNPRAFRDPYNQKEWGWGYVLYVGDIPQYDYQSPTVDIQTTGIATDVVSFVRSLFR